MAKPKKLNKITREQFLAQAMSHEPDMEKISRELVAQLHAYERKYGMRSEIFFKLIVGTPLEDQDDFLDWATCYRQYFKTLQAQFSEESVTARAF